MRVFVTSRKTPTLRASLASYSLSILNGSDVYLHSQTVMTLSALSKSRSICAPSELGKDTPRKVLRGMSLLDLHDYVLLNTGT